MQKKQAKVFAGLLSMSLAVSLMTPLQGVSGQAARRKIALSKKSVTMTVGQKKTIRIKNAKGKRIKWSIKNKTGLSRNLILIKYNTRTVIMRIK